MKLEELRAELRARRRRWTCVLDQRPPRACTEKSPRMSAEQFAEYIADPNSSLNKGVRDMASGFEELARQLSKTLAPVISFIETCRIIKIKSPKPPHWLKTAKKMPALPPMTGMSMAEASKAMGAFKHNLPQAVSLDTTTSNNDSSDNNDTVRKARS